MRRPGVRGFTLVELVMVIALSGLVMVMISMALAQPMQAFVDQSRRAMLVDQAAGALNRMTRDVRLAIPNSLRVSADGQALELLLIHSAARYRPNRVGSDGLSFSSAVAGSCGSSTTGGRCDSVQVLTPELLEPGMSASDIRWMVLYNVGAESGGNDLATFNKITSGSWCDTGNIMPPFNARMQVDGTHHIVVIQSADNAITPGCGISEIIIRLDTQSKTCPVKPKKWTG